MTDETKLVLVDRIESLIVDIRGQKVVVAVDLAALYGVSTKALNQAVKRNIERFPGDFMFQLTDDEKRDVVTSCDHLAKLKYSPTRPYVFTEHGVVMAASLLNSPRAVEISVFVVRAFVKLRQLVLAHEELAGKLEQLERKVGSHDEAIKQLVSAIRQLMAQPDTPKKKMGFHTVRESGKEPPESKSTPDMPQNRRKRTATRTKAP